MAATPTLEHARALLAVLQDVVARSASSVAQRCEEDGRIAVAAIDADQTVVYDLASISSAVAAAERLVPWGEHGELEAMLALLFTAEVAADLQGRVVGREATWGLPPGALDAGSAALTAGRDPQLSSAIAGRVLHDGEAGGRHLPEDLELVRRTFRRFAEDEVMPVAERIHREDEDVPEHIISGLAELGCFGLSVPEAYGGFASGDEDELLNMVLVTEELSRGSLGVAGSLITRPEIVGTAILRGGTEEQKHRWLPGIASGERMCAVAVTEPDVGSDVAGVNVAARREGDEWVIDGVKTWCTFAGRADHLVVLARTDPDRSRGHRGLSLFVVDKPVFPGHAWRAEQGGGGGADGSRPGGSMDARAIPTLGYRGMHSFEISFDGWRVPHSSLVGEDEGLGQGFYLQMQAFANGRLQTAARAQGVMQAALDRSVSYTGQRHVFGAPLADYELNRTKIARMAALLAASRVFSFEVARMLARGEPAGQLAAAQLKQLSCRSAEWVTREAQQLHGGYGYAEEYEVSRLFVDARVLSIFEGADELLAVRIIARTLLADALGSG